MNFSLVLRTIVFLSLILLLPDTLLASKQSKKAKAKKTETRTTTSKHSSHSTEVKHDTHATEAKHDSHSQAVGTTPSTQSVIATLSQGNQHFVAGEMHTQDFAKERKILSSGQKPYAIVLTCADSRVPPEMIFDEELGHLFVVRVAGNVVDSSILASIEYAAEHLGAKTMIVMGHEKCGAVKAACDHAHLTPNLNCLLRGIAPAVAKAELTTTDKKELLHTAIQENVRLQMHNAVLQSPLLLEMVEHHNLEIVGAVYDLETGLVNWLMPENHELAEHQE
ncbi:MAG: carbonic anhydrase [Candidatus Kapabacteria bacterium]|nr:carbonic anhydrase [Candidatus Kapabacteria bacterium]MBX7154668.1 carbonic anhydrase [Bacteroidota bacterium]